MTKTLLAAAALVLTTASVTLAQTAVQDYDGDGNRISGQSVVVQGNASALQGSFAGPYGVLIEQGRNGAAWQRTFDARQSQVH